MFSHFDTKLDCDNLNLMDRQACCDRIYCTMHGLCE